MTALRALTDLEYSRYNPYKWGRQSFWGITVALFTLLLGIGWYLFHSRQPSLQAPFTAGTILMIGIIMYLSSVDMLLFTVHSSREWILNFPHSRKLLLYAKAISLFKHGLYLASIVIAANIGLYVLFNLTGHYEHLLFKELVLTVVAHALFMASIFPLAIVCGLLAGTILMGWKMLLLVPFSLLWLSPLMALATYLNSTALNGEQLQYLSPSYILLYTLGILLIGWPLSYMLIQWIAKAGLERMSEIRYNFLAVQLPFFKEQNTVKSYRRSSGFQALYQLERSRLQYFEGLIPIKVIKGVVLAGSFILFYLFPEDDQFVLTLTKMQFILPVLVASIWIMCKSGVEQKQLNWRLSLPHPRLLLITSSIVATGVTVLRLHLMLSIATLAGIGAALAGGRTNFASVTDYLHWFAYIFLTSTLMLILSLCLVQISYYLMKSKILIALILPLYMIIALQQTIVNNTFLPENIQIGQSPNWPLLGWVTLIGLPLAAACLPLGARYLHLIIAQSNETAIRKKH
ncbi:hypothetical protein A8L34_20485 [Bacillus sp. FJAT-27264]|uniref:hypothetical protein n=1 Tax=Paenibacillus sp. (strain DSM 101736 / FJAT-27264) TaxID=1850362 RepID=UPI000807E079|nr:hypothetical protein [Bacillus sp. FJAT-27264]OBZ09658.1 hypothetical protein A8L34_20485 [Bacillus sp. FJAT-27264]